MSGNLVDVCPVGALLQKPQSFESRPWELRRVPGIDVMDAVGSNIRFDVRQRQVMRILPRVNDDVNEEWISDKTRHHVDALVRNRLDRPWVREKGKLREASWTEALDLFAEQLKKAGASVAAIAGDLLDAETMYAAKKLLQGQGSTLLEGRQTGLTYDVSSLAAVNFNSTIAGIENADVVLLVGSNPRWEAPLVNTRLRKAAAQGREGLRDRAGSRPGMKVDWLGNDLKLLGKLPKEVADAFAASRAAGGDRRSGRACRRSARRGAGAGRSSLNLVRDGWNGFNVLHTSASRMAGLILGYAQKGGIADIEKAKPEVVLLLGADEVDPARFAGSFKVYIGHHGDNGARQADLVLPGAAYAEKHGTYVNIEGRVQRSERAAFAPGDAREDWTIFRAVSDLLGSPLPFDRFDQLRAAMIEEYPQLGAGRPHRLRLVAAEARRQGRRRGRLSDPRLLPDQRDRPRQPDHAPLLGRAGPRPRRAGGRGVTAWFQSWGISYEWAWFIATIDRHPGDRAAADAGGGDDHLCRPQDLGGDRASPRPERGRPVGPAAKLRRRPEGLPQGNDHPVERQPRPVPDRADHHLHDCADRLGGDPVRRRAWCSPTSTSACSTSSRHRRSASTA